MEPIVLRAWPKALQFERGGTAFLGSLVDTLGSRALVVCGRTVANGKIGDRVRVGLGDHLGALYDGVRPHTPFQSVVEAAELYAYSGANVIVSVGGGSATDTGKAVAILAAGGALDPYRRDPGAARDGIAAALPRATPPHIAVPTVPGAGNILLPTAGVLDAAGGAKMLFDDERLIPAIGLLDAELLAYCPRELTAITSVRAIVGAIESLYARRRNPFSTSLALESIRLMREALPFTLARPHELDARERSFYAAVLGTMAAANSGVSVVHALGLVIGARYGVAHGIPHAMLLAPAMRAFAAELAPAKAQLAVALNCVGEDPATAFDRLAAAAGLPTQLRAIDVPRKDLAAIAEQAAALPIMQHAPRSVPPDEIRAWLEARW